MAKELWVEKYRPKNVDEYVFQDDRLKSQVKNWIKEKTIPHLLLSGPAGTGKTSLAEILKREIGVDQGDILYLNGSDKLGIDAVSGKITNFATSVAMGQSDFKVIHIEEADHISPYGQACLRKIMEDYADNCRIIMTCNYVYKIIPAIRSRSQEIILQNFDLESFKIKIVEILLEENVDIDEDVLDTYIKATFPDLRKCINTIQLNVQDGVLLSPKANEGSSADWQFNAVQLFKKGDITAARKAIVEQIKVEEIDEFFKLCYRNLDWFGKTDEAQDTAIIIIRDGMVKHMSSADPEINLSAMLVELARIGK